MAASSFKPGLLFESPMTSPTAAPFRSFRYGDAIVEAGPGGASGGGGLPASPGLLGMYSHFDLAPTAPSLHSEADAAGWAFVGRIDAGPYAGNDLLALNGYAAVYEPTDAWHRDGRLLLDGRGAITVSPVPVDEATAIATGWQKVHEYDDGSYRTVVYADPRNPSITVSFQIHDAPPVSHGDPRTEAEAVAFGWQLVETTTETVNVGGVIVHYTQRRYVNPATGAPMLFGDEQEQIDKAMQSFHDAQSGGGSSNPWTQTATDVPAGLAAFAAAHGLSIPDTATEALAAGWEGGTPGPSGQVGRDGKPWSKTVYVAWPGQPAPRDALLVYDDLPAASTGHGGDDSHHAPPLPIIPAPVAAKSPLAAILAGAGIGAVIGGPVGAVIGGVAGYVRGRK